MITLCPLAQARVLIVGAGDLVDGILNNLKSYGVDNVTLLDASTTRSGVDIVVKDDPQTLLHADPSYFKSFDIVLSANQPRPFEVALSDLRWPSK
jgi:glutamyl-tRNA reductase